MGEGVERRWKKRQDDIGEGVVRGERRGGNMTRERRVGREGFCGRLMATSG